MQYQVFNHTIVIENENIKTYGIVLYVNNCEVLRIYDVSTDYQAIIEFIDSINEKHLDPFKLGESLEDFINKNWFYTKIHQYCISHSSITMLQSKNEICKIVKNNLKIMLTNNIK